ncbi:MAG: ATP synthase subunit I [Deltaproteobacteria bacterium]|nr:ATP synthase subunit I [Deltaproteobacteria bacterium]
MMLQDEALLKRIEMIIWVLLGILSLTSFALCPFKFSLGVFIGGVLAVGNFYLMKRNLRRALDPARLSGARFFYLFKYYLRFAALGIIIALLLISGRVSPFGLLLGLSIIVIGIVLVGFNEARKLICRGVV